MKQKKLKLEFLFRVKCVLFKPLIINDIEKNVRIATSVTNNSLFFYFSVVYYYYYYYCCYYYYYLSVYNLLSKLNTFTLKLSSFIQILALALKWL